jgi:hypothetical protein
MTDEQKMWMRGSERAEALAPKSDSVPAFGNFIADVHGNLWVQENARATSPVTGRWFVFDTTGVLRRTVWVPPWVSLVPGFAGRWRGQIGDDYLLGHMYDMDQVEKIVLLPLRKR